MHWGAVRFAYPGYKRTTTPDVRSFCSPGKAKGRTRDRRTAHSASRSSSGTVSKNSSAPIARSVSACE